MMKHSYFVLESLLVYNDKASTYYMPKIAPEKAGERIIKNIISYEIIKSYFFEFLSLPELLVNVDVYLTRLMNTL